MAGKNILVMHGGGPTAVINASLYGIVAEGKLHGEIAHIYGAHGGPSGLVNGTLIDLGAMPDSELVRLRDAPGSAIGTGRDALAGHYPAMVELLIKNGIDIVMPTGGNGTMNTCALLQEAIDEAGADIQVIGVPKTMDNDIAVTDHCPGFGSAAKYIATSCAEVYKDAHVYDTGMVCIIEIMGRHAGWLTASAALAGLAGCAPDLIYLPETDFDMEKFVESVERVYREKGNCIVAVSEGVHYADGSFVSEAKTSATDGFGHAQLGGLASLLAQVVKEKTGAKVRGIELSLLQRCGAHLASETDIEEAVMSGKAAVENAVNGITDKMVGFERSYEDGQYVCKTKLLPLTDVANTEKKVPIEWINAAHNGVEKPFIDYVLPLIQGEPKLPKEDSLPRFAKLKKVLVK